MCESEGDVLGRAVLFTRLNENMLDFLFCSWTILKEFSQKKQANKKRFMNPNLTLFILIIVILIIIAIQIIYFHCLVFFYYIT